MPLTRRSTIAYHAANEARAPEGFITRAGKFGCSCPFASRATARSPDSTGTLVLNRRHPNPVCGTNLDFGAGEGHWPRLREERDDAGQE